MALVIENRAKPRTRPWPMVACLVCLLVFIILIVYYGSVYDEETNEATFAALKLTTRYSLEEMREFAYRNGFSNTYKPSLYVRMNLSFNRIVQDPEYRFDIDGRDVLVFLHMQKTAGTSFERFLVRHLNISRPCICNMGKKRCSCYRPSSRETWLFSRYSTGWSCGLHADYTEMVVSGCVDRVLDEKEGKHNKRRYYYTTFLREPIERFVSEYRHVARGATWLASRHICNGKPPTPEQLPMCFDPQLGWDDVGLDEYLACPFNMAFNRQTRMLADLTLVNCYDTSSMNAKMREKLMLESAKANLKNMAYFGIKERMADSQFLFEHLFDIKFTADLSQWNKSKSQNTTVTAAQTAVIRERNRLDVELYDFALKLFNRRLNVIRNDVTSSVEYSSADAKKDTNDTKQQAMAVLQLPTSTAEIYQAISILADATNQTDV